MKTITDAIHREIVATVLSGGVSFVAFKDGTGVAPLAICRGYPMPYRLFAAMVFDRLSGTCSARGKAANEAEVLNLWEGLTIPESDRYQPLRLSDHKHQPLGFLSNCVSSFLGSLCETTPSIAELLDFASGLDADHEVSLSNAIQVQKLPAGWTRIPLK